MSGLRREDLEGKQELTNDIDEVLAASERAAELTSQLLVFSRSDALNLDVVDLNEVVHNIKRMLKRILRDNTTSVTSPS